MTNYERTEIEYMILHLSGLRSNIMTWDGEDDEAYVLDIIHDLTVNAEALGYDTCQHYYEAALVIVGG